ncbi:MAG TPA: hypothetical protein VGX26_01640 [Solirubrobacteraceae bacterium]|nr:hypothetical protein [Solirubrobacteraceae bacterium]
MLSSFAGLLRLASLVICLIVIASFTIFVVNQTSSASTHQQEELGGTPTTTTVTPGSPTPKTQPPHKSTVHKTIDEASDELTSPFSGITSGFSSQWAIRGIKLLLALVLYGFGLGFLARVIRVRV